MSDIHNFIRVRHFFGDALMKTILSAMSVIGFAIMLTAVQAALAAPSPP
jgi:hypothetical protein